MGILEQWKLDKKVVWQSCIFWTNAANYMWIKQSEQ